jgi:hypothetical protein
LPPIAFATAHEDASTRLVAAGSRAGARRTQVTAYEPTTIKALTVGLLGDRVVGDLLELAEFGEAGGDSPRRRRTLHERFG